MTQLHISLAAEAITRVGGLPVTNSLIATWLVMAFLIAVAVMGGSIVKKRPGYFQLILELIVGGLFGFLEKLGGEKGKQFTPILVTFFLFIVASNWAGLLPGFGTIGINEGEKPEATKIVQRAFASTEAEKPAEVKTHESTATTEIKSEEKLESDSAHGATKAKFVPLFRGPTADLNTTVALGLIAFSLIQYAGFKASGISYLKKFFNFGNPINTFIGLLEIISDFSKIISFGFRLFGNIFAGEVLLAVMSSFLPALLPLPFLGLEIFVGVIQALVFAMLTAVFINLAQSHGSHEQHAHAEAHS